MALYRCGTYNALQNYEVVMQDGLLQGGWVVNTNVKLTSMTQDTTNKCYKFSSSSYGSKFGVYINPTVYKAAVFVTQPVNQSTSTSFRVFFGDSAGTRLDSGQSSNGYVPIAGFSKGTGWYWIGANAANTMLKSVYLEKA